MKWLVLVLALLVAGCTTLTLEEQIAQIQSYTRTVCQFVPTASTVAQILAAGSPELATGIAIANAICASVTSETMAEGPTKKRPTVAGVAIRGTFVR